jgi:PAS domain S-box-containing protein
MKTSQSIKKIGIIAALAGFAVLTAAFALCLYVKLWELSAICGILWVYYIFKMYGLYTSNIKKIVFTLDALENKDYSFRFDTANVTPENKKANETLNKIKQIVQKASSEAKEREKYYEQIIDSVDTGIITMDANGNILQNNRQALKLLGLSVLTHYLQLNYVSEKLESAIENIQPGERVQVSFQDERGTNNLSLSAASSTLNNGKVRIIAINDIENELDVNELDSWIKLIRVLTHEIMNSVTPITSLSETLLSKAENSGPEIREGLSIINKTSNELTEFVESYRKFTHIPTPVPHPFYIKEFAERMKRIALEQNEAGNININISIVPEDLMVYADENLIAHVMTNLLKNAIQAITEFHIGGKIQIDGRCDENEAIIIDISDDGPLIPEDVAEHIFIPFFTTKKEGSGIGLSLSKQIMRLSGGTLTMKTNLAKQLTVFTMKFK